MTGYQYSHVACPLGQCAQTSTSIKKQIYSSFIRIIFLKCSFFCSDLVVKDFPVFCMQHNTFSRLTIPLINVVFTSSCRQLGIQNHSDAFNTSPSNAPFMETFHIPCMQWLDAVHATEAFNTPSCCCLETAGFRRRTLHPWVAQTTATLWGCQCSSE